MTLTRITEENIRCFYGLLGPWWDDKAPSDVLIGGVDDDGDAVSACSLSVSGLTVVINFFAVSPSLQRIGIGRNFLIEVCMYVLKTGFQKIESIYFKEGDEELVWEEFLKDANFHVEKFGVIRNYYSFEEVKKLVPTDIGDLPDGCEIVRGVDHSVEEAEKILAMAEAAEEKGAYVNADSIFSEDNRYGGVLYEDGEAVAALSAVPFEGNIRIETILVDPRRTKNVRYLMAYMMKQAEGERTCPAQICIESPTDEFSMKLLKLYTKAAPAAAREEQAYRAWLEV
ncbi:MAG: hypothetical protein K6B72_02770 [Lachnospiraceae bacterium]|nr:hypothetical protein [Lachnospiraceae bacterium]